MMFRDEMKGAAEAYGLSLTEKQQEEFLVYYRLLVEWNERMNLTALTEPREVAVKHMVDSLAAWEEEALAGKVRVIDVGTGAGFPGLPLKIFLPDMNLTLLDSLGKRVDFLQHVVKELGLKDVECIHGRAEELARKKGFREGYDAALSRAVARLPILAEYCMPFLRVGGVFLAWKGRQYREEAKEAKEAVKLLGGDGIESTPIHLPGLEDVRAILRMQKKAHTPRSYPRKAGMPAKKPLGILQ